MNFRHLSSATYQTTFTQWPIQIPAGGNPKGGGAILLFGQNFPKICSKMKAIGPRRTQRISGAPPIRQWDYSGGSRILPRRWYANPIFYQRAMLPLDPPVVYNINNWFMVLDDDHLNSAQKVLYRYWQSIIMNQKLRLFSRDRRVNISIMLVTLLPPAKYVAER